jgi:mycofactocin system glycosyltransferase
VTRLTDRGALAARALFRGEPVGAVPGGPELGRRLVDAGMAHPVPPDPGPQGAAELSVVVPVRDDPRGLNATLEALDDGSRLPVVVVDDASLDPAAVAAASGGRATVIRRDRPGGPGAARGTGLEEVTTARVAFVDAGVVVAGAELIRLAAHLGDPCVVAVAPRVRSAPGGDRLARYEASHSPLDLGPEPGPVRPGGRVAYVPTACLVTLAGAVRRAGGFDPALRWGEDVDLVWRLAAAGGVVRYEPAVTATHPPRPTLRSWLAQRYRYGNSAGALARRHGAQVAPVRCSVWSAVGLALALAGHPVWAAAVAAATARALRSLLGPVPDAGVEAVRLAAGGHWWAARALSHQLVRTWWPVTAAAALHPRGRRLAAAGLAASVTSRWVPAGRGNRLETAVLGLCDDLAYGTGVWAGVWAARGGGAARALLPVLVKWPARPQPATSGVTGR